MTNTSKTVIFFGTDDFSLISLRGLIKSGYKIAAVVTKPDSKKGRGQVLEFPSVKKLAIEHGIEVWQPSRVEDINDKILSLKTEVIGVLVSFGKIIPESTIKLFTLGIINVHPSLLPLYRGPSPIETAIENGDPKTGVSIMQLTPKMDAGPIYGQVDFELYGHENRIELRIALADLGASTLLSLLPGIFNGSIQPKPQNEAAATYCRLLNKSDAWLKTGETTAIAAERIVRAHLGFPKTKIEILGHDLIITKAHVADAKETPLDIQCQGEQYLSIDKLVAPSGRTMSAKDFLNGYN